MAEGGGISTYIGTRGSAIVVAVAAVVVAVALTPVITGGGGGGGFTSANLWIDGSGTCTRTSGAGAAYNSATACATFDAAWDAATAGDLICIAPGTYGTQVVTGNKASTTTISGNCGGAVTIGPGSGTVTCTGVSGPGSDATFCPDGTNMKLSTVTIDTGSANDVASVARVNVANVTFEDVDTTGTLPNVYVTASGFLWDGGSSGAANYTCFSVGQPTQIDSGSMTIQGVTFGAKTITGSAPNTGNCGEDGNPHLEYTRIQCNCPVTLKNNFYAFGGAPGSGYIFSGISTALDDLVVVGNYFADADVSSYMQSGNLSSCTGWKWLYNTFDDGDIGGTMGFSFGPNCAGGTSAGNLGPSAPGSCANHVKNVTWGSGSCGTDTLIGSASLGVDSATGRLESGSPGIDGGETAPGTYCGGSDVAGLDREGGTRGTGGVCDAGADER